MPPLNTEQARWFSEEVQRHEPMLRAWLRSRFPGGGEVDDIVQEAYLRVLQSWAKCEIRFPKAFLFATARNLALGRMRHDRVSNEVSLAEIHELDILDDSAGVSEMVGHAEELELLTAAIQSLPTCCRRIITLRKIYGLSQKEIAAQLGIAEHTVEAQGTIGLRKIANYFERFDRQTRNSHE